MKTRFILPALAAFLLGTVAAHAQAPASLGGNLFTGSVLTSTGSVNGFGMFTELFSTNGIDYTVGANGAFTAPVGYSYSKTGATTATVTEGSLSIALTFTSTTAGTFNANYGGGSTQTGTFTLASLPTDVPLLNMSNRVTIASGQSSICGWVVGGPGPRRVLVRAVGPTLTSFGVSNVVANPNIAVYSGNTVLVSNDDWANNAENQAAFAKVGAFGLNANSKDAAVVVTVNPGIYSAVVRGASGDSGEVLIEVYYLD